MSKSLADDRYKEYLYPENKTNWSDDAYVKNKLEEVNFDKPKTVKRGGIPIISDGKHGFIDSSDNHCAVIASSGAGKSLAVFAPLICTVANAGESFCALDLKGELYERTAMFVSNQGHKMITLDFREFQGDGFNALSLPYRLYKKGERDKALSMASELINALAAPQSEHSGTDPFWPETAKQFDNGAVPLMVDSYPDEKSVNFLSLAENGTTQSANLFTEFANQHSELRNTAMTNLRNVLSEPEKTRMSSLATANSFISAFNQSQKLARMLSHSTFDIQKIPEEKTAIYLLVDDTSTCAPIISIFITQLQTILRDKAYHSKGGKLDRRFNFILDEFANVNLPNLTTSLATDRSRQIRYFLCIQSLDGLKKKYPNYRSLLVNCNSTIFLGSTEDEALSMVSSWFGDDDRGKPLISTAELMTLKKSWFYKEGLYLNLSDSIRYCTVFPAIEVYKSFTKYGIAEKPKREHPPVKVYTIADLMHDISSGKAKTPFSDNEQISDDNDSELEDIQKELERKFDEIFKRITEED